MNDKTTIKLIKIITGDKSISDNDKIEAIKKLTDSTPFYYQPTNPIPCPDQYPIYPVYPWDNQPMFQGSNGTEVLCKGDLTIENINGQDIINESWLKFSTNFEPYTK